MARRWSLAIASLLLAGLAAGCGGSNHTPSPTPPPAASGGFHSGDCNLVTDAEVTRAAASGAGAPTFTKVVTGDAGCFWQENSLFGSVGAGMGISTWWYRGSDMDTERMLEQQAGRTITELSLNGNKGFKAADDNACSIYVVKDSDVITWSVQSLNPASLPALCSITEQLAQLSQDRVN